MSLPYRQIVREDESVKTRHLLASEMTFATFLVNEQDANSEADRRFDIYRTRRDRYKVPLASSLFAEFNLNIGDKVLLKLKRFRLDNGKPMVVTGIEVDLLAGITTLDLWG